MRENKDIKEAEFVRHVRNWYDSIDNPGIDPLERLSNLLAFKNYILEGIDFGTFPPKSTHKGFTPVSIAGFFMNTDTRLH